MTKIYYSCACRCRFVVGAAVVHALNMTAIYFGTREPREKTAPAPMLEEKSNGAIMLY